MRIIMHIDVNNAFLSWEALYLLENGSKYDIRDSFAVIGGDEKSRKGIVLAKSNACKRLGIVTAEPLFQARKKCKVLKVYSPHFDYYRMKSNQMMDLIKNYSPDIEIASIDECYIDYTKVEYLHGNYLKFALKLQKEILEKLGFTVNIGIANNKLCAKMASDLSKPYKIHTIFDNEIVDKMYPLPIEDLFGIGKKTAPKLRELNINTIGDLANFDESKLISKFKNQAIKMIEIAKGIDDSPVVSEIIEVKGISHSTTLKTDTTNKLELYKVLEYLTEQVCIELRNKDKQAYVVTTFIKNNKFKSISHQKRMKNATNNTKEIVKIAKELLDEINIEEPVRLIGVRVDNFTDSNTYQLSLFENIKKEDTILDKTVDNLKKKYGLNIIDNASKKAN